MRTSSDVRIETVQPWISSPQPLIRPDAAVPTQTDPETSLLLQAASAAPTTTPAVDAVQDAATLLAVLNALVVVVAVLVVPRNRRPTTALAWILAITLVPAVGLLLFFLFGTNQLPAGRRRKQAQVDGIVRAAVDVLDESSARRTEPPWLDQVVRLNRNLTAIPLTEGNSLELHGAYLRTIHRITQAIDEAEDFVHVLYYALALDETTTPFFDALERAVRRGVTVRVLYDHVGSMRYSGYRRMRARLRQIGCAWRPMLSLWPWEGGFKRIDLRNHRKLVVIDGQVAFIGSQNMIARDYHKRRSSLKWKDLVLRIDGPMAAGVNAVFISDWFAETDELLPAEPLRPHESGDQQAFGCQLVPSGPGYENENNLRLFNQVLYSAERRAVIVSPYFVPDDSMLYALTTAVQRGVEVELFVGEIGDQFFVYHAQRSYYEALLRAGVRIWLYRRPYILHSKHCTIDDAVTLIGSSNMDMRSFTLNAELMLMVHGEDFVARMREVENGYRSRSYELTAEAWRRRPIASRALDNFARLTSVIQ